MKEPKDTGRTAVITIRLKRAAKGPLGNPISESEWQADIDAVTNAIQAVTTPNGSRSYEQVQVKKLKT